MKYTQVLDLEKRGWIKDSMMLKILKRVSACILCVSVCVHMWLYAHMCVYAHEDYCVHVEVRWEKNLKFLEVCSFQCLEFDDQRPSSFVS